MRIEPPPSDASAIGTMPAPTEAPPPPDEPPATCSCDHGEHVGPHMAVSVVPMMPHSEVVVRPTDTRPACSEAPDQPAVGRHHPALRQAAAVLADAAGLAVVEVFEQERHAAERAVVHVGAGCRVDAVLEQLDHRAEPVVDAGRALGGQRRELLGSDLPPADELRQLESVVRCVLSEVHGRERYWQTRRRKSRLRVSPRLSAGKRRDADDQQVEGAP